MLKTIFSRSIWMIFQHDRTDVTIIGDSAHDSNIQTSPENNLQKQSLAHCSLKNKQFNDIYCSWLVCIPINMAHNWNMKLHFSLVSCTISTEHLLVFDPVPNFSIACRQKKNGNAKSLRNRLQNRSMRISGS